MRAASSSGTSSGGSAGVRHTQLNRRYPVLIDDIAITDNPGIHGEGHLQRHTNHKVSAFHTYSNKIFENYGVGERIVTADALIDEEYPNATDVVHVRGVLGSLRRDDRSGGHWGDFGDYKGRAQASATTTPARIVSMGPFRPGSTSETGRR